MSERAQSLSSRIYEILCETHSNGMAIENLSEVAESIAVAVLGDAVKNADAPAITVDIRNAKNITGVFTEVIALLRTGVAIAASYAASDSQKQLYESFLRGADDVLGSLPRNQPSELTFTDYAKVAGRTAYHSRNLIGVPALLYTSNGFAGEAGEVANKVKKVFRDDGGKLTNARAEQIQKEMAGALWYFAELAYQIGVPLADIAKLSMETTTNREAAGTIRGDGDNR